MYPSSLLKAHQTRNHITSNTIQLINETIVVRILVTCCNLYTSCIIYSTFDNNVVKCTPCLKNVPTFSCSISVKYEPILIKLVCMSWNKLHLKYVLALPWEIRSDRLSRQRSTYMYILTNHTRNVRLQCVPRSRTSTN